MRKLAGRTAVAMAVVLLPLGVASASTAASNPPPPSIAAKVAAPARAGDLSDTVKDYWTSGTGTDATFNAKVGNFPEGTAVEVLVTGCTADDVLSDESYTEPNSGPDIWAQAVFGTADPSLISDQLTFKLLVTAPGYTPYSTSFSRPASTFLLDGNPCETQQAFPNAWVKSWGVKRGVPRIGHKIAVTPVSFTDAGSGQWKAVKYQWLVGGKVTSPVKNAHTNSLSLSKYFKGKSVSVRVTIYPANSAYKPGTKAISFGKIR